MFSIITISICCIAIISLACISYLQMKKCDKLSKTNVEQQKAIRQHLIDKADLHNTIVECHSDMIRSIERNAELLEMLQKIHDIANVCFSASTELARSTSTIETNFVKDTDIHKIKQAVLRTQLVYDCIEIDEETATANLSFIKHTEIEAWLKTLLTANCQFLETFKL